MSSILDALRKHERDGDRNAPAFAPGLETPMTAEEELAGLRPQGPSTGFHAHPAWIAFLAASAGAAFVLIAVAAGVYVVRTQQSLPTQAYAADGAMRPPAASHVDAPADPRADSPAPAPAAASPVLPQTPAQSTAPNEAAAPAEDLQLASPPAAHDPSTAPAPDAPVRPRQAVSPPPTEPASPQPRIAVATAPQEPALIRERIAVPALKAEPQTNPGASQAAIEPKQAEPVAPPEPSPEPETPSPAPPPKPAEEPAPTDRSPSDYPRLSPADSERLGLPPIKIYVLALPTPRRPQAHAVINGVRLREGDTIPYTGGARLAGISARGIAIDASGEQFFIPLD